MKIDTERLLLVACTLDLAEALQREPARAEALLDALLPDGWPDAELAELLPLYAARLRADPALLGYGVWIAVERSEGGVVGSAGFTGRGSDGVVELGFGIHPSFRNAGYATEAASALVEWALAQEGVHEVVAECERENAPSVRVLEKIGLQRTGERGSVLLWSTASNSALSPLGESP